MKKERIRKPNGRYLIYYSFDPSELLAAKEKRQVQVRRQTKRGAQGRGR